jgi:hypothetical protein
MGREPRNNGVYRGLESSEGDTYGVNYGDV